MRLFWLRTLFWIFFSIFFAYKAAVNPRPMFFIFFAYGLVMFFVRTDCAYNRWRARQLKKIEEARKGIKTP